MARLLAPKLALARAVGVLSRLRGGGATSAPGKFLLALEPDALGTLASRLKRGSVLISATNGKTTTATLATSILERHGVELVHNQTGANMAGGIASTLLSAARPRGQIAGELGLFEVDELWLEPVAARLQSLRAVLLSNLFRDQLDRYGELETIADSWVSALKDGPTRNAMLVLNADDSLVADLGRDRTGSADGDRGDSCDGGRVVYFGVDDDSLALAGMAHAADAKHCRRCGAPYVFDAVYLGHLGHYHCPNCGQSRPKPAVSATGVSLHGVRSSRFTLRTSAGEAEVALALPGLYNVYNALAAAALASTLDVPLQTIVEGLQTARAAFGRAETIMLGAVGQRALQRGISEQGDVGQKAVKHGASEQRTVEHGTSEQRTVEHEEDAQGQASEHGHASDNKDDPFPQRGRELRILLVKNPAGANEVLRTLALEPGEHDVIGVLNDNIADGRDVSWIWDADFELLAGRVRRVTCAGTRAPELAVRLKYAGIDPERIVVHPDLARALDEAAGDVPSLTSGGVALEPPPLYALPTYTAMLSLRELLVARGHARSAWS